MEHTMPIIYQIVFLIVFLIFVWKIIKNPSNILVLGLYFLGVVMVLNIVSMFMHVEIKNMTGLIIFTIIRAVLLIVFLNIVYKVIKPIAKTITKAQKRPKRYLRFKNPSNGYIEEISSDVWAKVFFLGFIYFAVKGVWTHAFVSFILAPMTLGISWLIYPFFTSAVMRKHYLRKGWIEISD